MKRILLLLALFFCFGTVLGEEPAPQRLDLPTAVQEALTVDPEVLEAQAALDSAKANVEAELAKIAPGCTVKAGYDQSPHTILGDSEIVRSTAITFTISQNVPGLLPRIIGGKAASAVEQALWNQTDTEAELAQAKITAAAETIEKYLAAIEADEMVTLNGSALELAKEDESIAQASLAAGTATRLDLLKAESNREKAALDLQEAEEDDKLAREALLLQIGRPFGTELVLAPVPASALDQPLDLAELTARALAARGEVLSRRTAVRKAEAALTQSKNNGLPSLKLSGTEQRADSALSITLDLTTGDLQWSAAGSYAGSDHDLSSSTLEQEDDLELGLELTWNPFDGGARRAAVAAAEAALAGSKIALAKAENEIRLEVRQLLGDLKLAFLRLAQAEKEKDLAAQARELALVRYREGVGLFSDLHEATQAVAEAEAGVVQAEFAAILAQVHLEQACGGMSGIIQG